MNTYKFCMETGYWGYHIYDDTGVWYWVNTNKPKWRRLNGTTKNDLEDKARAMGHFPEYAQVSMLEIVLVAGCPKKMNPQQRY